MFVLFIRVPLGHRCIVREQAASITFNVGELNQTVGSIEFVKCARHLHLQISRATHSSGEILEIHGIIFMAFRLSEIATKKEV